MALSLTGLASGIDSEALIQALMQAERRPLARLQLNVRQETARQTALRDVQSKLRAVRDAANDLRSMASWRNTQSVESSGQSATARLTGGAAAGAYEVTVLRMAQSAQQSYDITGGLPASFTVTPGGDTTSAVTIEIPDGATPQEAADAINSAGSAVTAVVVEPGDGTKRLVLTSRVSGAQGAFTTTLGTPVAERAGADAQVKVAGDDTVYTSSSNVIAAAVPGVELTLKSTGTSTVTVSSPALDKDVVVAKAKAFVTAYNAAVDLIRSKVNEQRVVDPQTDSDRMKGLLRGDAGLQGILSRLRTAAIMPVDGFPRARDQLSEIGISTGKPSASETLSQDALAGKLTLDEDALRAALDSDPTGVRALLGATAAGGGAMQRLIDVLEPDIQSGGIVDDRIAGLDNALRRLRDREADMNTRLDRTEARLKAQFAALEKALSQAQSRSAQMSAQLAGLFAQ